METTNEIFEYLSLRYKNSSDLDYFNFLIYSVQQNYEAENYHFALVALHMIYMGIVYHYIYGIFKANRKRFEYVLIGFTKKLEQKAGDNGGVKNLDNISWHNFSVINEKEIFDFYISVGIKKDMLGNLKEPVNRRNSILHANGSYINNGDIDEFEKREVIYLKNIQLIHRHCSSGYKKLYKRFLKGFKIKITDKAEAEEFLTQNFIKEYGINQKIILDLVEISKKDYPKNIKIFFDVLQEMKEN